MPSPTYRLPTQQSLAAAVAAALMLLLGNSIASAQEATSTPSTTQPAMGHFAFRETLRYSQLGTDPVSGDTDQHMLVAQSTLQYGVTGSLSLSLDIPAILADIRRTSSGSTDTDSGFADITLTAKYRIWKNDSSPLNTTRLSVIGGLELPTGDGAYSSDSVDPIAGLVLMSIIDRWGFSQAIRYKFNTSGSGHGTKLAGDGPADALRHDTALLYRLDPAVYSAQTKAAVYAMLECNGLYETNGDYELTLAPGILYEATTFAVEFSVIVPAYERVTNRAALSWGVALGVRFLF